MARREGEEGKEEEEERGSEDERKGKKGESKDRGGKKGDNADTSLLHTSVMHLGEMHKVTHPTTKTRLFLLLFFNGASSDRIIWWHLVGYHNA